VGFEGQPPHPVDEKHGVRQAVAPAAKVRGRRGWPSRNPTSGIKDNEDEARQIAGGGIWQNMIGNV